MPEMKERILKLHVFITISVKSEEFASVCTISWPVIN
jgi:hypothetical protein